MNENPKPRLRWFQFNLRSLFLVMLLACIGMSWVGVKMQRARNQREAVEWVKELGGWVSYDYEVGAAGFRTGKTKPSSPHWLLSFLGDDFFRSVVMVNLNSTQVADNGLKHLETLPHLATLCLNGTKVTDEGVKKLQHVLPNCEIRH